MRTDRGAGGSVRDEHEVVVSDVPPSHDTATGDDTATSDAGPSLADDPGRPAAILEAVTLAAERFLSSPAWEPQLAATLEGLGEAAAVSRAYVFDNEIENGEAVASRPVSEWVAPGITSQINNPGLRRVPYRPALARWIGILSAGTTIHGHVRNFPASERELLEPQEIVSIAMVPIFAGAEWWGLLGFDECVTEREWTQPEIGALKTAAGIIGAAIERERREAVLRETEDRYRRLVELSPDAIAVHRGGVVTFANSRAVRMFRASSVDDLVGRSVLEFVHPDSRSRVLQRLQLLREGREVPPIEEKFVRLDGTEIDVEVTASPFTVEGEAAAQVVVRDISDRKATEHALRVHSEYLEALHETTLNLVNRLDPQDLLAAIVGRAGTLLGTGDGYIYVVDRGGELEVQVGTGVFAEHVGFRMQRGEGLAGRVLDTGEPFSITDYDEWEGRSPNFPLGIMHAGAAVPLTSEDRVIGVLGLSHEVPERSFTGEDLGVLSRFAELASIALDNARLFTASQQEITERRRAEERLRFSAHLLDSVENAVVATDAEDRITYWNAFASTLYGWPAQDVLGRKFRDVLPISPEAAAAVNEGVRDGSWEGDVEVRRRDGSHLIVFARVSAIRSPDGTGRPTGLIGVMVDVTERRRAEEALREAFEREKEVSQRLLALDEMKNTFLEAVSHELRTPLAAILGFALTLERPDVSLSDDRAKELLDRLAANARRLDRLLSDLLDLDRLARGIVEPRRRAVDVGELARQVIAGSEALRGRSVEIDAEPVVAWVDGAKVERIIENLAANAIRHTPDGTSVWVRVRRSEGGVLIAVEDSGVGVPPALQEAIFEPFRQGPQTRSHSPGVGVGLSLVLKFADLHGGRAWAEDREGGGASFRVWLPSVEPVDEPPPSEGRP
jgi:PAS domain S-box-containing protein